MEFIVKLDNNTLIAIPPQESREKEWTLLDYHKCSICPLDSKIVRNCPIAFNISGLIERFSNVVSFENATIYVTTPERTYFTRASVQNGLRSILGIYNASSGCPHMKILKPMVRFHLPFASTEETVYRQVSCYLMSQYFAHTGGMCADIDLQELRQKNKNIDLVNKSLLNRIREAVEKDANLNALTGLNTYGAILELEIECKLESYRYLFE